MATPKKLGTPSYNGAIVEIRMACRLARFASEELVRMLSDNRRAQFQLNKLNLALLDIVSAVNRLDEYGRDAKDMRMLLDEVGENGEEIDMGWVRLVLAGARDGDGVE